MEFKRPHQALDLRGEPERNWKRNDNLTITIVKMIIAYAQAQIQRKLQYIAKSAKIDAKKKLLTVV
jgi:hypothetical protein